jgi:hypothetical protein
MDAVVVSLLRDVANPNKFSLPLKTGLQYYRTRQQSNFLNSQFYFDESDKKSSLILSMGLSKWGSVVSPQEDLKNQMDLSFRCLNSYTLYTLIGISVLQEENPEFSELSSSYLTSLSEDEKYFVPNLSRESAASLSQIYSSIKDRIEIPELPGLRPSINDLLKYMSQEYSLDIPQRFPSSSAAQATFNFSLSPFKHSYPVVGSFKSDKDAKDPRVSVDEAVLLWRAHGFKLKVEFFSITGFVDAFFKNRQISIYSKSFLIFSKVYENLPLLSPHSQSLRERLSYRVRMLMSEDLFKESERCLNFSQYTRSSNNQKLSESLLYFSLELKNFAILLTDNRNGLISEDKVKLGFKSYLSELLYYADLYNFTGAQRWAFLFDFLQSLRHDFNLEHVNPDSFKIDKEMFICLFESDGLAKILAVPNESLVSVPDQPHYAMIPMYSGRLLVVLIGIYFLYSVILTMFY